MTSRLRLLDTCLQMLTELTVLAAMMWLPDRIEEYCADLQIELVVL